MKRPAINRPAMKKVLVTGSTGLIGSRIVTALLQAGVPVCASARSPSSLVAAELGTPLVSLDVLAPEQWCRDDWEVEVGQVDCLIHCATANDIVSRDAKRGFELSLHGTENVLELARSLGISRVIYFSTFQVYGTELSGTVDELRPVHCESNYGLNHWFGEELCRLACRQSKMAVAVVRPSNVYGAPVASSVSRETLVPTCFVQSALNSGALELRSSGLQYRNFVSTEELARACLHLLQNFPSDFQIYNLCSAYSATIRDIAELTAAAFHQRFGRPLPVHYLSHEPTAREPFVARSRLESIWDTPEQSRAAMQREIALLIEQMSPSAVAVA